MKRHYVLLYFFLLALLAMTGMFLGCSTTQAYASSYTGSVEQGGDAIYVASNTNYVVPATTYTRPNNNNNPKDGMWLQYVGRTPAFANCNPCAESPSYKATGKKSSKKSKKKVRRTATKKKSTKTTAKRRTALPPTQADLFPDAICPPGCVPEGRASRGAPRITSLGEAVQAAPSGGASAKKAAKPKAAPEKVKQMPPPTVHVEPSTDVKPGGTGASVSGTVSAPKEQVSLPVVSNAPQPATTMAPAVSVVPSAVTSGTAEISVKDASAKP